MKIENNNYGWQVMHSALGDAYTVLYKALMYDCKIPHSELKRIISVLETALRVKERNCDVGTAEEQFKRYHKFCMGGHGCSKCRVGISSGAGCSLAWAQMPYEAKEGAGGRRNE